VQLDLFVHPVRHLAWGPATRLEGDTLVVARAALLAEVAAGLPFAALDAALAAPGESCRLLPVFDVVEPRARVGGGDFPGVLSPIASVGSGETHVLRGAAVVMLDPVAEPSGRYGVIDMSGPAADYSPYAHTHNLALLPQFPPGLERPAQQRALRVASLRAAVHLARAALAHPPAVHERYALTPVPPELPRVAYVYQLHSQQHPTQPGEPILYGDNVRHLLPTWLHPNEILDGAVLRGYRPMAMETYGIQNHAVVRELYRRHGTELAFVGVVATVAHHTQEERERAAVLAANLVTHGLRAAGAVLSKAGGGAPHVDMAQVAHLLEQRGVRTTLLAWELSVGDAEGSALFNYPTLDAIVNYGSAEFRFALPPVERLLTPTPALAALAGAYQVDALNLCGAMDQLGGGVLTAVTY
jgi:sarcosine reductase